MEDERVKKGNKENRGKEADREVKNNFYSLSTYV